MRSMTQPILTVRSLFRSMTAIAAASLVAVGAMSATAPQASAQQPARGAKAEAARVVDRIVFRNGRTVEGEILEETDTTIQMRIVVAGISTVTTYAKSELLEIQRGAAEQEAPPAPAAAPGSTRQSDRARDRDARRDVAEDAPRVAHFKVEGQFGRDVSQTPLLQAFERARSVSPDVIIIEMDSESRGGFDGLFVANIERMTPAIEQAIANGQRVVFWIKKAQGGAAFLPFVSPEIYFQNDGRLGGIGTLQSFDMGNKRVNEKQISLRLGHAEGLAITGGYAPELIRAMARQDYWLAFRIRGGEIEYMQRQPTDAELSEGWIVLSDDGQGSNKDKMEDIVRGRGNDVLNLNAERALQLNVSKGTANTLEDLAFQLGYGRDFQKVEIDSQRILTDWATRVDRAEETIQRTLKDLEAHTQRGGNTRDPRRAIGEEIRLLQQLRSTLGQFEEIFDPDGSQRAQIDVRIAELRLQLQRMNR